MTTVYCDFEYCAYNINGVCTKDRITIGEEYAYVCDDFLHYQDTGEYSHPFYKAVKMKDGVVAKALSKRGKKIEYQGLVFYTEDRVFDDEIWVTEERTGFGVTFSLIKDRIESLKEKIEEFPNVQDYPLAEPDSHGKWKLKESEEA